MYREEDGLTPGQLKKKKYLPTPTDKGTVTLTAVQIAALSHLCLHRKWYYSPRVPMNGGIYGIEHANSLAYKSQHRVSAFTRFKF